MVRGVMLTNQDRTIILGLTLLLFFGIFLIGRGFTGMYLIDFPQESCSSDDDCLTDQKCCEFYKEDSGVCEKESNCQAIEQITREAKAKISTSFEEYKFTEEDKLEVTKQISSHLEKPMAKNNNASIIVGAILLILGIIWVIYLKKE